MSSSPPTTSEPIVPDSNHRESLADFVRAALKQLDIPSNEQDGHARVTIPEEDQAAFDGKSELTVSLDPSANNSASEPINLDGRFCQWLLSRLHEVGPAIPVRPVDQPTAVKDITERLFAAYTVDDGRVHLGGCQLTDYPFLRLSFAATENGKQQLRHIFVAHDGSSVSDQLANDLGLLNIEPVLQRPPRIDEPALQSLITAGRRVAAQSTAARDPNATTVEPTLMALVWVKHASGQLSFTIGETTVSQAFSGWAKLLTAKPYTSPVSGASSFHLAATDDGRIDTIDQIAVCAVSGRRVLRQELVTCSVTGKQVLEEFTETCPVSGKPCLTDEFVTCPNCQQQVSKLALQSNICTACRSLQKIKKDDPRLVWILGEHAGLDRWKSWQLAETKTVYIAQATSWTKRLLAVVDKETLAVHHLATASRLSSLWSPVADTLRDELLK